MGVMSPKEVCRDKNRASCVSQRRRPPIVQTASESDRNSDAYDFKKERSAETGKFSKYNSAGQGPIAYGP
jgi:hypothetical protein